MSSWRDCISVFKRRLRKSAGWILLIPFCLGFRVYKNPAVWSISAGDPTIWIKPCSTEPIGKNNLPSEDRLYDQTLTTRSAIQSIIDDYNDIQSSYVRLAMYPTDPSNPGSPLPGDSTFTTAKASRRTIEVCFTGSNFAGISYAQYISDEDGFKKCEITMNSKSIDESRGFVATFSHELGHCLGLDHNHEALRSIMSYYHDNSIYRIQIDDKMAMVYLYPQEPDLGYEEATFGLRCSPK